MKSKVFKWLYGLFCFVPALAVFSTCAYVALNDNAKDSYNGNITEAEYVNYVGANKPIYDIYFSPNRNLFSSDWGNTRCYFYIDDLEVVNSSGLTSTQINSVLDAEYLLLWFDQNLQSGYVTWTGAGTNFSFGDTRFTFKFDLMNYNNDVPYTDLFYRILQLNSLDDVFYYSTHEVENNGFFSWVKGNFLYTGMNDFCGIFNAQNTFVSFYLTYVLTISLCYLAFEVLMLFINMARNLINSLQSKEW